MFAGNGKISGHQVSCLMFVDWIGKLLLLLPAVRGSAGGWDDIAAIALGGFWAFLYLVLLARLSAHIDGSFTGFVRERLGKCPAQLTDLLFLLYLLANQAYLARLAGRICSLYLLPEISETTLAVCVLAVGATTAVGDSQKRARTAELLFYPVAVALALMLIASMGMIRAEHLYPVVVDDLAGVLRHSGRVFLAFSGVALILYETSHTNWGSRERLAALRRGHGLTLLFLLTAFITSMGVLGGSSLRRLSWPIPVLMSSASLPGGFLQRWDAVFLAFLLLSLLVASGTVCHYMKRILGELLPQEKTARPLASLLLLSLGVILLTGNYERAAELFTRWAFCCLMPLVAALPALLWAIERTRIRKGARAAQRRLRGE